MRNTPETSFHHYPVDVAMCDCEATHTWDGVDCISVRRRAINDAFGLVAEDRCMECNQRWPAASTVGQSSLELVVPCSKFAERQTPCVPVDGVCAQCGNANARAA
jgi:hypothetical protein